VLPFWCAPLAWMIGVDIAGPLLHPSFNLFGVLPVLGTLWWSALCLTKALRCGRSHCWIDGTVLPALAVLGAFNLAKLVTVSWITYFSAFWLTLVARIVVECVGGSYPRARPS
jgi:hypothetical protein